MSSLNVSHRMERMLTVVDMQQSSARFVANELRYDLSPIGLSMQAKGVHWHNILACLPAVDNMWVTLNKRLLLHSEKRQGEQVMTADRSA